MPLDWKAPLRPAVAQLRRRLTPPTSFYDLPAADALRVAYQVMLRREPDQGTIDLHLPQLEAGTLPRDELTQRLRGSEEFRLKVRFQGPALPHSLHVSRCEFIQSLPRASRILDVGGAHHDTQQGALVAMGYPYAFEELTIVDLPSADRHPLYRSPEHHDVIDSHLGPVRYRYHSMSDLTGYDDSAFDLVYSGQSIEHITPAEAKSVLAEIHRILAPGGYLALDTPNGRICRLQQDEFIDPDHEVEYTHREMVDLIEGAGLTIVDARGLNYMGRAASQGRYDADEVAGNQGLFAEIDDCYLLAYVARRT
ncbi:MAG TPA: methyltransferase domain-containing protein [Acidimicrobiales bacterium]|nr:methyltransferase domain-containing protein [Acidimicrobiales bacterium]